MRRYGWLLAVSLVWAGRDGALTSQTLHRESPLRIFAALGLTPQEVAAVDSGRPVAKVLSWGRPSEVYVFGAIHVDAAPDIYLKNVRDIAGLTTTPGYLAVGGFYLLTLKGSQQEGLTGVRGSLLRKVVVDKTRTSLERALASIKRAVEHSPSGG